MADTKRLNVTDIDYQDIRNNLKQFLNSDPNFTDYDFEGSALSSLIDILSYVTHINAVNANIGLNETFLNSAQSRRSVAGHAQRLGYTPKSDSAPTAFLNVQLNGFDPFDTHIIPRGYKFKTNTNGRTYNFVTLSDHRDNNDGFFENVKIVEGTLKSAEFLFDVRGDQKFLIPDNNIDTTTVKVEVQASKNNSNIEIFSRAKSIITLNSFSAIYFINENAAGKYEVSFGDGVIGKALEDGNIIRVEYITTNKDEANGARVFSITDPITGISDVSIQVLSSAAGGGNRESIESIKRNAPITFASQNRAVTPKDFEAIILENVSDIRSVKAWGGENNDPPEYGLVDIAILPQSRSSLSRAEKNDIIKTVLIPKSMVTVTPRILDPELLGITFEVFFKFDPSLTNLGQAQLENNVTKAIEAYNDKNHNRFDTIFRYSNFLKAIDESDTAIINSFARVYVQKRFVPRLNIPTRYVLDFSVPLYETRTTRTIIHRTSTFTFEGLDECRLKDFPSDTNPEERNVFVVTGIGPFEKIIRRNVGVIRGTQIILFNFAPQEIADRSLLVEAIPNSYDISSSRSTIIFLDCTCKQFKVFGEPDEQITGIDPSGTKYNVIPKLKENGGSSSSVTQAPQLSPTSGAQPVQPAGNGAETLPPSGPSSGGSSFYG